MLEILNEPSKERMWYNFFAKGFAPSFGSVKDFHIKQFLREVRFYP